MSLARLTGYRFHDHRTANFRWGEVSKGWGIALELCHFEEWWSLHVQPLYGKFYIHICRSTHDPEDIVDSWGAAWEWSASDLRDSIMLHWGARSKFIHLPWGLDWARTSTLMADGSYFTRTQKLNRGWGGMKPEGKWAETLPYRYVLKSGEVQERQATIGVEEMEWRRRATPWLPWFRKVRRYIDVSFDGEVGEGTGSWKGGTLGCGYELRAGESPETCLRRMERERVFGR